MHPEKFLRTGSDLFRLDLKRLVQWLPTVAATARITDYNRERSGSVAEWLACWTQAQKAWVQIAADATLSCNSPLGKLLTHIVPVFTKQRNW